MGGGRGEGAHLDVLWQECLVDDSFLLQVLHRLRQLVGILESLLRRQARLREG